MGKWYGNENRKKCPIHKNDMMTKQSNSYENNVSDFAVLEQNIKRQ